MKKIFIFTLFILAFALHCEEEIPSVQKIQGSKELPMELNLLIDVLQNYNEVSQINEIRNKIAPVIKNIDLYASNLNKEDIFLIGKIEIYKTLLKSTEVFPKAELSIESVTTLRNALKKTKDPFLKWFIEALMDDVQSLLSNANYKEYVFQKANGRLEKLELKKIEKKVQLLYRWISKINPALSDFQSILKAELSPVLVEALKNIEQSFFMLSIQAGLPKATATDLKFFAQKEVKLTPPAPPKREKTVEDILAPLTDEDKKPQPLPQPSKEDWLNEDNTPANLKNLPKPSNDADWLEDI